MATVVSGQSKWKFMGCDAMHMSSCPNILQGRGMFGHLQRTIIYIYICMKRKEKERTVHHLKIFLRLDFFLSAELWNMSTSRHPIPSLSPTTVIQTKHGCHECIPFNVFSQDAPNLHIRTPDAPACHCHQRSLHNPRSRHRYLRHQFYFYLTRHLELP